MTDCPQPQNRSDQQGAALIEFALVFMLLMTIALGAYEFGMAFRDSLAVSSAAREGARVGSAVGDRSTADCAILEAAAGALHSISGNEVSELWIYRTDTVGTVTATRNEYRPSRPTDDSASLVCETWFPVATSWSATGRDNEGTTRDWIGVKIFYDHDWKTGFLWWTGSARWAESAVMHLEPAI